MPCPRLPQPRSKKRKGKGKEKRRQRNEKGRVASTDVVILAHSVLSILPNAHLCLSFCLPYYFTSIQKKIKVNLLDWQGLKSCVTAEERVLTEFAMRPTRWHPSLADSEKGELELWYLSNTGFTSYLGKLNWKL